MIFYAGGRADSTMEYDVLTIIKPVAAGLLLWFCLPHSIVLSGKRNLAKQITGCVRR